jgi:FtsP/CotA-like multicopper oxidase with cupredoxin domain
MVEPTSGRSGLTRRSVMTAAASAGLLAAGAGRAAARGGGRVRTYYVAADTVTWDYTPQHRNLASGKPYTTEERTFTSRDADGLGTVYLKSRYRQYTDASFATPVDRPPHAAHLGVLGPVLRAEVGDTIRVVFRNNTPYPASVHPHGVFYDKSSEGALYSDGTKGAAKADDAVAPGGTHTYTWPVPERAGPGPHDPSSVVWLYHDHSVGMGVPGTHAGLIGPIVVSRRGQAWPNAAPTDVDREMFALFTVFDESQSPYLKQNIARFGTPGQSPDGVALQVSNRKASINGYMFANGPAGTDATHTAMVMRRGERVRWYVFGIGGGGDMHTPHWHGNTVLTGGRRTDVLELLPATMTTADMRPDNPGMWLFHCHVDGHMTRGMVTRYQVR